MIGDEHALTPGYVRRHLPPGSNVGIEIAILDIAQDFLLAHLHERGVFGEFADPCREPVRRPRSLHEA